jgi:hypothetical protein
MVGARWWRFFRSAGSIGSSAGPAELCGDIRKTAELHIRQETWTRPRDEVDKARQNTESRPALFERTMPSRQWGAKMQLGLQPP